MSEKNRNIHILFETLAVLASPYILFLGSKQEEDLDRFFLYALGLGSLFIDGYLLYDWLN